jgi:hypothetical protein
MDIEDILYKIEQISEELNTLKISISSEIVSNRRCDKLFPGYKKIEIGDKVKITKVPKRPACQINSVLTVLKNISWDYRDKAGYTITARHPDKGIKIYLSTDRYSWELIK